MSRPDGVGRAIRGWVPRWWKGEGGALGHGLDVVLWPAEGLFRAAVLGRNRAYDAGLLRIESAPIPVVSIGNLGVGGAGKTPVSSWIAARLAGWGHRPAIVLRGYGADEILVHREINPGVPVFAAAGRIDAVREAAGAGCDVAVLDDGFQHRALARQLDLALVSADAWGDDRRLLPRGPWREGLGALRRADLVIITRKAASEAVARQVEEVIGHPIERERIVRCRIVPEALVALHQSSVVPVEMPIGAMGGRRILAVSSLADPGPFAAHLTEAGGEVELAAYPDHHAFTAAEAMKLAQRSGGRPIVMTRKEAVKLRPLLPDNLEAWMLEQRVEMESGGEALDDALRRAVRQ